MKKLRFKESCTQYSVTRNRYGDLTLVNQGSVLCLYRDKSVLGEANDQESENITGIFWLDPNTFTGGEGDVLGYNGKLYRIMGVTKAKELLTSNAVHFYKCTVHIYRAIS